MNNKKEQMHPQDMRNLIVFVFLAIAIWSLYEVFVLKPQQDAIKQAQVAKEELIASDPVFSKPVKIIDRADALKDTARVVFENDKVFGTISLVGGMIDDLSLKDYYDTLEKKNNVVLLSPHQTHKSRFMDYGWVSNRSDIDLPNNTTLWRVEGNAQLAVGAPVTLVWVNNQGIRFERIITLDNEYVFSITQRVVNNSGNAVAMFPYARIAQSGVPDDYQYMWVTYEGPMGFVGDQLEQHRYKEMRKKPAYQAQSDKGWIGFSDKYWLTALIPDQKSMHKYRFQYTADVRDSDLDQYQTDMTGAKMIVENGATIETTYNLYAGAKKVLLLEDYQEELGVEKLELAVDFGWFWFFTYPFFLALHYLTLLVGNVGVAIIALTIAVRMAVYPLTSISYRSFAKMKVVAPRIAELRAECGDDKQKLQAGIIELYQKEQVNPMSGCLPVLVQIPIFFAFYKILLSTIEMRHAPFFGWIDDLSAQDPTSIFNLFGLLPYDVPSFFMIGIWPCLMLAVMLVQKKLNPPPQDKLQRDMMRFFPFMITFVMSKFAAGLVIYWTFSALVSVLQQMYIMRSLGVPIYIFEKDKAEEAMNKAMDNGPDVHPLAEMAEDEAEKALFGEEEKTPKTKAPAKKKKSSSAKGKKKK